MDNSTSSVSESTGPNAILLPICAALVIAANYVPLVLLLRVRKVAACTLVIVLAIVNAFTFINAILWPNNNTLQWYGGAGLCDVQVAIKTPLSTLLAASSACLSVDLAKALDTDNPRLYESRKSRHRRLTMELGFCFTVPILQVALHYVVQAARFAVVTVYGCTDAVDESWPTVVILSIWPLIFALLNCYYSVLVMHRVRKHRGFLSETLSSSGSGLNTRRFLKLFFLSASILVVYFPVTVYFFYINVHYQLSPYSWSRVHDPTSWYQIPFITTATAPLMQFDGWVGIAMAGILFFLYGMNSEGIEIYRGWFAKCGFAKIFPRLLQPTELPLHRRGSSSRGSWYNRFDLVSRAIHYYDESTKGSQPPNSDTTESRKGSEPTFKYVDSPRSKSISTSTTIDIELATPSPYSSRTVTAPPPTLQRPVLTHQPPLFTSPFRTHINLPFLLFSGKKPTSPAAADNTELQLPIPNNTTSFANTHSSVETSIWSNTDPDVDLDPLAPRMGIHAYRERERHLHEKGETSRGVLPDTVTVDFGTPRTMKDGVKVETKLDRIEEVSCPSSS